MESNFIALVVTRSTSFQTQENCARLKAPIKLNNWPNRPNADDRTQHVSVERSAAIEEGVALKTVILYPGSARFTGAASFDWASPTVGSIHRFILFLAQSDSFPDHDVAKCEVESFGFCEIDLGEGRKIDVESLNDPKMAAFRRHYEGAFAEGCSLIWYP